MEKYLLQVSILLIIQTIPVASWLSLSPSQSSSLAPTKTNTRPRSRSSSTNCMNSLQLLRHSRNHFLQNHYPRRLRGYHPALIREKASPSTFSSSSSLSSSSFSMSSPTRTSASPLSMPTKSSNAPLTSENSDKTDLLSSSSLNSSSSVSPSPSSSSIAKSLAIELINYNTANRNSNIKLSMAIAGGGSSAISTITSTNNASSTFITGNVLYDRYSFAHYISSSLVTSGGGGGTTTTTTTTTTTGPSSCSSSLMIPSIFSEPNKYKEDTNAKINMNMTNDRNGLFGYCSPYSSMLLSYSSLKSTVMYSKPSISTTSTISNTSNNNDYNNYIGVGCTSALVSQSKEGRNSKIYITIMNGFGDYISYDVILDNGIRIEGDEQTIVEELSHNDAKLTRRNRSEEEDVVGALILWCTHHYLLHNENCDDDNDTEKSNINAILQQILNRSGDSITVKEQQQLSFGGDVGDEANHGQKYFTTRVTDAANHVLQQTYLTTSSTSTNSPEATAVVLAPNYRYGKVVPTAIQSVLPSNPIIFPGSFNPVHFGHVGLAKAAIKTMERKAKMELLDYYQKCSPTLSSNNDRTGTSISGGGGSGSGEEGRIDNDQSVLESLWNTTEYLSIKDLLDYNSNSGNQDEHDDNDPHDRQLCQILFEMSLTNPDKPSMDPNEVARRIEFFNGMVDDGNEAKNDQDKDRENRLGCTMPNNWGILLTSAPLFIDKVRLLREYLAPSAGAYDNSNLRRRLMTFVIGTDTMVRIINPKYYDNNVDNMLEAVREMGDLGAHFVVGGRLEQSKNNDIAEDQIFVTGEEELVGLPEDVREMFTIINEEDFRIDISSSEIRARSDQTRK